MNKKYILSNEDKKRILDGSMLKDIHIDIFHNILRLYSSFDPTSTMLIQTLDRIKPHDKDRCHLQILHSCDDECKVCSGGHWICCYYDTNNIFIYDSLNQKRLHPSHEKFLRKLFPFFDTISVQFPEVQYQKNGKDCGVLAIAFATSILLNKNPAKLIYDYEKLRPHLYNMIVKYNLKHFPTISVDGLTNTDRLCSYSNIVRNTNNSILKNPFKSLIHDNNKETFSILNNTHNNTYNIRSLQNKDNVSCYANASLQSLLNCACIRQKIFYNLNRDIFNSICNQYISLQNVEIKNLREFAGQQYMEQQQQDVAEFIMDLCNKSIDLDSLLHYHLSSEVKCTHCNGIRTNEPIKDFILPLHLPETYKKSKLCTLQYLIDENLGHWTTTDGKCKECNIGHLMLKHSVETTNNIIIVQLKLFKVEYNNQIRKANEFKLQSIENQCVQIGGNNYKVINAICHHGSTITSGHYTTILNKNKQWLRADDSQLRVLSSPISTQDIYILFLEKTDKQLRNLQISAGVTNIPNSTDVCLEVRNKELSFNAIKHQYSHNNADSTLKIIREKPKNHEGKKNNNSDFKKEKNSRINSLKHNNITKNVETDKRGSKSIGDVINKRNNLTCTNKFEILANNDMEVQDTDNVIFSNIYTKYKDNNTVVCNQFRKRSSQLSETEKPECILKKNKVKFNTEYLKHNNNKNCNISKGDYCVENCNSNNPISLVFTDTNGKSSSESSSAYDNNNIQQQPFYYYKRYLEMKDDSNPNKSCEKISQNNEETGSKNPATALNANKKRKTKHKRYYELHKKDINLKRKILYRKIKNNEDYLKNSSFLNSNKIQTETFSTEDNDWNSNIKFLYENIQNKFYRQRKYYNSNKQKLLEAKRIKYSLNTKNKSQINISNNVNENNCLQKNEECKIINYKKSRMANIDSGKKVKYEAIRSKNIAATFIKRKYMKLDIKLNPVSKLLQNNYKYVEKVTENITNPTSITVRRMEADELVSTAIHAAEHYMSQTKHVLKILQNKLEISLAQLGDIQINGNEKCALTALCGKQKHVDSSEAYFTDAEYNFQKILKNNFDNKIIFNDKGQSTSILPIIDTSSKTNSKTWLCDIFCKTEDADILQELKIFFEDLINLTFNSAYHYLHKMNKCSVEYRNTEKLGHPLMCYEQPLLCSSKYLKLIVLSYHYPRLRTIRKQLYTIVTFYKQIFKIQKALHDGDVNILKEIAYDVDKLIVPLKKSDDNEIILDEKLIRSKLHNGIKAFTKIDMDPPRIPCISCERLFCERNIESIEKYSNSMNMKIVETLLGINTDLSDYWSKLQLLFDSQEFNNSFICQNCIGCLKKKSLPSTCIINNLFVKPVPHEITSLNMYEKILIQRAKVFQTIVKMSTVMKKNLPNHVKIDKVKGRAFHLPLPLEETMKKICKETDPLNINHEVFILVRSCPTKAKIIWEDYVDVTKIWRALFWLKENNHLYSKIDLPANSQELLNTLKNLDLEYEGNFEINNQDKESGSKVSDNEKHHAALFTQKLESDPYYEQYTIYPLHDKKFNETDQKLYQMLQVYAKALDIRSKDLDLKCFPDLYPYGVYGQHQERQTNLRDFDFIKSRLMSKHPRFRLNKQYLFYLLFNNNIRQISAGIFHKLNVVNPKYKCTAGELLQKLKNEELEQNVIDTVFHRLRGTEAFWKKARSDLNCMMYEYGPGTFFVTLSPGEWMWPGLAEYIREVNKWDNDKKSIGELIVVDPVSASRYIHNKFQAVLAYLLSSAHPIGKISHYYYCVEYQGRGLPHFHCIFWIEGAPIYGISSNEDIQSFILQYITCRIPNKQISPQLYRRVTTYQQHKHNSYCMRTKKTKNSIKKACRFSFPRSVTKQLKLRPVSVSIANKRKLKNNCRFYDLPRSKEETFINDYMPALLILWEGNNDAQFICESSYLLTKYVSNYETKGEKSNADFSDIQSNQSLCARLWSFCLRALNHRECGAIEAADALLGHSLYATDPDTLFKWLDVRIIRSRKMLPFKQLNNLPADSTELFYPSLVDSYYPNRPRELESMCLYDFAKWFDIVKEKPKRKTIEFYEMGPNLFCKKRKKPFLIKHWNYNPKNEPENYYHALLLLFQPWRDLDELKNTESTYFHAFKKKSCDLAKAMEYHDKCKVIQDAIDKMNEMIQNQLMQPSDNSHSSINGNVPEDCVPIEIENAMKDFEGITEKVVATEADLLNSIKQFNEDQSRVFKKVISVLQNEDKVLRIFISGPGGTGKSFVIENIVTWNKIFRRKDTAVTAPTGIAAYNINGLTIHRLLQLPVEHGCTAKYKELSAASLKQIRQSLGNVDLIIIDEISMVSNIMLLYVHLRLTEIFDTSEINDGWFGKKHVIVFGDLLQLPPVHEEFVFKKVTKSKIDKYVGAMNTFNLWDLFDYDELIINMRQKDDTQYTEILSRIRLGFLNDSDIKALESRKVVFSCNNCVEAMNKLCQYLSNLPSDTVCLLPTRSLCDSLNLSMLSRIDSEEIKLVSNDSFKCTKNLKKKILQILNDDDSNRCGIEQVITIKIGCKIMIRRNIDISIGLVNGSIGTVISISKDKDDIITAVQIRLQNDKEYGIQKLEYKFSIMDNVYITRQQFPICISYGITIHKSQGLSLNNAVIEGGNKIFSCGQTYVALSRVTKLEGVHLINFDPSCIKADGSAILEYNRLRQNFRPDLQLFDVSNIHQKNIKKVIDTPWNIFNGKSVTNDNDKINFDTNNMRNIYGISNTDEVSSFANTCIQSLFHSKSIRRILKEYNGSDSLKYIFSEYVSKSLIDTITVRRQVNEIYALPIQRDASEFLERFCNTYNILKSIVPHSLTKVVRCCGCDSRIQSTVNNNYILMLHLPEPMHPYKLQEVVDYNIGGWREIEENCENCKTKKIEKLEIEIKNTILIIKLFIFNVNGIAKMTNFRINEIPQTVISISNKKFKVMSGIFHHGISNHNGYYTNMLRQENVWFKVHDLNVMKRQWPRGAKDLYLLFLERVIK